MQRGINKLVNAIRPTLGPRPRLVAIEKVGRDKPPELLDSGGTIARRVIDLPDADENIGAMYVRGLLWRLQEKVGDGTATAAVMFQEIFNRGLRYIAAGGNAMLLRNYLENGLRQAMEVLDDLQVPVEDRKLLNRVAHSVCYDPPLAESLAEIFDLVGEYGIVQVRSSRARDIEREYIEGSYWTGGLHSREMITDAANKRAQAENAALLISDLEFETFEQLEPALRLAVENGYPALVIMASKISDAVTGLLVTNQKAGRLQTFAVKTPTLRSDDQQAAMEDLAVLTGGRPFVKAAGDTLASLTPEALGQARRIWADMEYLGIVGGKGSPLERRDWIKKLSIAYHAAEEAEKRNKLCERVGRLYTGSAVLWLGGMTESEIEARKELTARTIQALRAALYHGVLPGGGAAFLACRQPLRQALSASDDPDEQAALRILLAALEAPFRTIVQNAGLNPAQALNQLEQAGPGATFDVTTGKVAFSADSGVLDIAEVARSALHSAVLGASLALTIDAFVHRHKPPVVTEPD